LWFGNTIQRKTSLFEDPIPLLKQNVETNDTTDYLYGSLSQINPNKKTRSTRHEGEKTFSFLLVSFRIFLQYPFVREGLGWDFNGTPAILRFFVILLDKGGRTCSTHGRETGIHVRIWWESQKEREYWEYLDISGKTILK
jgi:hypothetical protein